MKRALALLAGLGLLGFAGLAQFSGTWKGEIQLLPAPPSLTYTTLSLTYEVAGWKVTSNSKFTSGGFSDQSFDFSGALGPISIEGSMAFDPVNVLYKYTDISSTFDFAGLSISSGVFHGIYPYAESYFNDAYYPYTFAGVYTDTCQTAPQTDSVLMFYTVKVSAEPVSVTVHLSDCCTGIQFYDFILSLKDISLCCGITYDFELAFNKHEGFDYAKFSMNNVFPICCGISFDISVKFTTDGKTLTVTPVFAGFGKACFELYADLEYGGGTGEDLYLNGIRIDGWKISCELAECNKLEIVSFLSPENAPYYGYNVFQEGEFEYMKLSFCGPTCCGGKYNVGLAVYFTSGKALFGISRIGANVSWPLAENFTITAKFSTPNNLSIGWEFKF